MAVFSFGAASDDFEVVDVLNEQLAIDLPVDLKRMTDGAIKSKYAGKKIIPLEAYENEKEGVSFAFNMIETAVDKKAMKKVHKSFSDMLHSIHPQAKWKKDKLNSKYGTKVAIYEFEIRGINKRQYQMIYAFPVNNKLVLVTFISTNSKYKSKWVTLARESFSSIDIL